MEFFSYGPPRYICLPKGKKLPPAPKCEFKLVWDNQNPNENFLTKQWFKRKNGSHLRTTLMSTLLRKMAEQAKSDGKEEVLHANIEQAVLWAEGFENQYPRFATFVCGACDAYGTTELSPDTEADCCLRNCMRCLGLRGRKRCSMWPHFDGLAGTQAQRRWQETLSSQGHHRLQGSPSDPRKLR
jgi:uncharacterized protein YcgI (DUF1989 family)